MCQQATVITLSCLGDFDADCQHEPCIPHVRVHVCMPDDRWKAANDIVRVQFQTGIFEVCMASTYGAAKRLRLLHKVAID